MDEENKEMLVATCNAPINGFTTTAVTTCRAFRKLDKEDNIQMCHLHSTLVVLCHIVKIISKLFVPFFCGSLVPCGLKNKTISRITCGANSNLLFGDMLLSKTSCVIT